MQSAKCQECFRISFRDIKAEVAEVVVVVEGPTLTLLYQTHDPISLLRLEAIGPPAFPLGIILLYIFFDI